MFQRMTVWAKNNQIGQIVIFAISVYMMHTQNFWNRAIPAFFASVNFASCKQCLSYSCKCRLPEGFFCFVNTLFAAIFSIFRRAIQKRLTTMSANKIFCAFVDAGFVVTLPRAIFCCIASARNVRKLRSANKAVLRNLNSRMFCKTRSRTKLERTNPMVWDRNFFSTFSAIQ